MPPFCFQSVLLMPVTLTVWPQHLLHLIRSLIFLCSLCVERKQIFIYTWKTLPKHQLPEHWPSSPCIFWSNWKKSLQWKWGEGEPLASWGGGGCGQQWLSLHCGGSCLSASMRAVSWSILSLSRRDKPHVHNKCTPKINTLGRAGSFWW